MTQVRFRHNKEFCENRKFFLVTELAKEQSTPRMTLRKSVCWKVNRCVWPAFAFPHKQESLAMREGKLLQVSIAPWLHFWVRHFDRRSQILLITHPHTLSLAHTHTPARIQFRLSCRFFHPAHTPEQPTLTSLSLRLSAAAAAAIIYEQVARMRPAREWVYGTLGWCTFAKVCVFVRHFTSPR